MNINEPEIFRIFDPKHSLIFRSGNRTLVTEGIFARIETPAIDGELPDSAIQRDVALQLRRATQAGISRPIVVGSVPFDPTRASALVIPKRYAWIPRQAEPAFTTTRAPAALHAGAAHETSEARETFYQAVRCLLELFDEGTVKKVVLSRMLDVTLHAPFDARQILTRLLTASHSGYPFFVPVSKTETLLGVSPELLLRKTGSQVSSNPLAGSIPRALFDGEEAATKHLRNSAKDLFEHRVVVDQVRDTLVPYCAELAVPTRPSLLRTPSMWHLSTLVEGRLAQSGMNALGLASALHPTPAVCGYPVQAAREAIGRVEGFDRSLFTGMTGWMDAKGDGEWVVTIRCALVGEGTARIFAGAGIVPGSAPELEWEETRAKMAPMLQVLGVTQREDV